MAKTRSKSTKKQAQKQPDVSKRPAKKLKVAANPTSEDVAEPSTSNHQIQIPQEVHEEIKADPLIEDEDNVVQESKEQPRASDMYLDTVSGLGTKLFVSLTRRIRRRSTELFSILTLRKFALFLSRISIYMVVSSVESIFKAGGATHMHTRIQYTMTIMYSST
jgi:uncharacterized membrane protein